MSDTNPTSRHGFIVSRLVLSAKKKRRAVCQALRQNRDSRILVPRNLLFLFSYLFFAKIGWFLHRFPRCSLCPATIETKACIGGVHRAEKSVVVGGNRGNHCPRRFFDFPPSLSGKRREHLALDDFSPCHRDPVVSFYLVVTKTILNYSTRRISD